MEQLHKIFVHKGDQISVVKSCINEEFTGMGHIEYDKIVNDTVRRNETATFFKIESIDGAIVGYTSFEDGKIKDSYIRKTFRKTSYIEAVKVLQGEEILLKTNGSVTYSRNKILN